MPALTICTSRFSDTAGTVADVQFASERKSYSRLTVQCGLKPYSTPAPTSQPSLVLDPFQVWPKAFTSAVLCTQPVGPEAAASTALFAMAMSLAQAKGQKHRLPACGQDKQATATCTCGAAVCQKGEWCHSWLA